MPPRKSNQIVSKSTSTKALSSKMTKAAGGGDSDDSHSVLGVSSSNPPIIEIPFEGKSIIAQRFSPHPDSDSNIPPALIFTHGAGGGISNPATFLFAQGFGKQTDILLYQGTMNLQSRTKACNAVIKHCNGAETALGGRSMGARAAVLSAKEHDTKALVLASYPLVGQNGELRDQILLDIDEEIDVLFISGDQDHMCKIEQLQKVREKMKAKTWLAIIEGADHGMSMKPKEAVEMVREYTGELAAKWLEKRDRGKTVLALSWKKPDKNINDPGWKEPSKRKTSSIIEAFAKAGKKTEEAEELGEEQPKKRRRQV